MTPEPSPLTRRDLTSGEGAEELSPVGSLSAWVDVSREVTMRTTAGWLRATISANPWGDVASKDRCSENARVEQQSNASAAVRCDRFVVTMCLFTCSSDGSASELGFHLNSSLQSGARISHRMSSG
jgi:hypothetical protein